MRNVLAGLLVVSLLAACGGELDPGGSGGPEDDAASEAPPRLRVTGDGDDVRLRSGPGGGYDTITRIPVGCLVDPTGPPDVGWLPIWWRGQTGWIYGANVEHAAADDADCP